MPNHNDSNSSIYGLIEQLPEMAYITNHEIKFVKANDFTRKLAGYRSVEAFEGDCYQNMPCKAAELGERFEQDDKEVLSFQRTLKLFARLCYANDEYKLIFGRKTPIQIQPDMRGVFCEFMDVENCGFFNISRLANSDANLFHGRHAQFMSYLEDTCKCKDFTLSRRESECLFFLLRGKSAKEIAHILIISDRTVEVHVSNIKMKFNVNTRSALIDKALNSGYMNIIPENILRYRL